MKTGTALVTFSFNARVRVQIGVPCSGNASRSDITEQAWDTLDHINPIEYIVPAASHVELCGEPELEEVDFEEDEPEPDALD